MIELSLEKKSSNNNSGSRRRLLFWEKEEESNSKGANNCSVLTDNTSLETSATSFHSEDQHHLLPSKVQSSTSVSSASDEENESVVIVRHATNSNQHEINQPKKTTKQQVVVDDHFDEEPLLSRDNHHCLIPGPADGDEKNPFTTSTVVHPISSSNSSGNNSRLRKMFRSAKSKSTSALKSSSASVCSVNDSHNSHRNDGGSVMSAPIVSKYHSLADDHYSQQQKQELVEASWVSKKLVMAKKKQQPQLQDTQPSTPKYPFHPLLSTDNSHDFSMEEAPSQNQHHDDYNKTNALLDKRDKHLGRSNSANLATDTANNANDLSSLSSLSSHSIIQRWKKKSTASTSRDYFKKKFRKKKNPNSRYSSTSSLDQTKSSTSVAGEITNSSFRYFALTLSSSNSKLSPLKSKTTNTITPSPVQVSANQIDDNDHDNETDIDSYDSLFNDSDTECGNGYDALIDDDDENVTMLSGHSAPIQSSLSPTPQEDDARSISSLPPPPPPPPLTKRNKHIRKSKTHPHKSSSSEQRRRNNNNHGNNKSAQSNHQSPNSKKDSMSTSRVRAVTPSPPSKKQSKAKIIKEQQQSSPNSDLNNRINSNIDARITKMGLSQPKTPIKSLLYDQELLRLTRQSVRRRQRCHQQMQPNKKYLNRVKLHIYDLLATETYVELFPSWGCNFPIGKCLNVVNSGLHVLGTGAYHCGIEVNGVEYAFGANNIPNLSGVFSCEPMKSPGYEYRTTVDFGERESIRKIWVSVPKTDVINEIIGHSTNKNITQQNLTETNKNSSNGSCFSCDNSVNSNITSISNMDFVYRQVELSMSGSVLMREMAREYMGTDYDLLRKNCCTFAKDACLRLGVDESEIPNWFMNIAQTGAYTEDTIANMERTMLSPIQCIISGNDCDDSRGNNLDKICMSKREVESDGFEVIAKLATDNKKGNRNNIRVIDSKYFDRGKTGSLFESDEIETVDVTPPSSLLTTYGIRKSNSWTS